MSAFRRTPAALSVKSSRAAASADTAAVRAALPSVSRRAFLAGAAAALAAPYVVPSTSLGDAARAAPSNRIAVGSIGMGSRGTDHLRALIQATDVQFLAVCDPQQAKREAARAFVDQRYGSAGCAAVADFREVVGRADIDAVVVAAPENWHALIMAAAARAGKDIYGEKALTLTVAEGRALVDTVRRYRRVFQVGTQQRSSRNFRFACELARGGYLGRITRVEVGVPGGRALPVAEPKAPPADIDYDLWLGPAPWTPYNDLKCSFNWYFIYDYCVGWIQSWGVHHVDIALWGAPQLGLGRMEIEGTAVFPDEGEADTSVTWRVRGRAADGTEFLFSDNGHHEQGCRFVGERGWVLVNRSGIWAEPASLLTVALRPGDVRLYESNSHHDNFLECIRTRRDPVSDVESGHAATTLTILSDIATRTGRRLTWDWAAERFVGDPAADRFLGRAMRSPWQL
jgi:predicted dehydrogenase